MTIAKDDVVAALGKIASPEGVPLPQEEIARRVGFEVLLPRYLPPGYRLTGSFVNRTKPLSKPGRLRSRSLAHSQLFLEFLFYSPLGF